MGVLWRFLWVIGAWAASGAALAAGQIRVFTTDYPPYAAPGLKDGGAAVLMLRDILRPLGHTVEVDYLPWARLARELKQQRYDLVLLAWPGDLSQHGLLPSSPWFVSRLGLFVRREQLSKPGLSIEALRGQSVGVVRDYAYPPEILAGGLQFELGTSDEQNLRKLAAGRFDYALLEHAVGRYLLRRQEAGKSAEEIVWQEPALAELPIHVGVVPGRPNAAALLEALELGLQAYKRDGRYQRLLLQHQLDGVPDLKLPRPVLRP